MLFEECSDGKKSPRGTDGFLDELFGPFGTFPADHPAGNVATEDVASAPFVATTPTVKG